ncbi:MAG: hypothetical protein QME81_17820 [bacterium]|nr:hypothetical protein [bacterium]
MMTRSNIFRGLLGIILLGLGLSAGTVAYGAVINVPADYFTIQAAVNAASDGDTIQVAAGTYPEVGVYINKGIALVGSGTPTIDPPLEGTAVTFDGNGADSAVISGFTITGSTGGSGYGIVCFNGADPAITNNTISENN